MIHFSAIPAVVARILAERPELSRPANLRERMGAQAAIVQTIAEAHNMAPDWGLVNEVGKAYAEHVPHA